MAKVIIYLPLFDKQPKVIYHIIVHINLHENDLFNFEQQLEFSYLSELSLFQVLRKNYFLMLYAILTITKYIANNIYVVVAQRDRTLHITDLRCWLLLTVVEIFLYNNNSNIQLLVFTVKVMVNPIIRAIIYYLSCFYFLQIIQFHKKPFLSSISKTFIQSFWSYSITDYFMITILNIFIII